MKGEPAVTDLGPLFDGASSAGALELAKLVVKDGWEAGKRLVARLLPREHDLLPEPADPTRISDEFLVQLSDYIRTNPQLAEALRAELASGFRITLNGDSQAAIQGQGVQNNTFRKA